MLKIQFLYQAWIKSNNHNLRHHISKDFVMSILFIQLNEDKPSGENDKNLTYDAEL